MNRVENDEVEKVENDKNGSLVNQRPLKSDGQDSNFLREILQVQSEGNSV